MGDSVIVSVCTITYNHGKYIAQAIESVLAQKCSYKLEMVISDDCSTDDTPAIIKKYADQYPDIIKPILNKVNLGMKKNNIQCINACKGKYLAGLEGDDYWTDEYKLQKQVDFLEANPEFSLCFSDVDIIDEIGMERPNPYPKLDKDVFGIEDVILTDKVFIPTPTMVFRNQLPSPLPNFLIEAISGDIALHLIMGNMGKMKRLNDKTAVYRQHGGGITKTQFVIDNAYIALYQLYENADAYFKGKYNAIFRKQLFKMSKTMLIFGSKGRKGIDRQKHIFHYFGKYLHYQDSTNVKEIAYYFSILYFNSVIELIGRLKK